MKYNIIYADPPWHYKFGQSSSRYIINKYPTMEFSEICLLDVKSLCSDNAILLMWATFPKLDWAIPVMMAWGFEYKTCAFVWIKTNKKYAINQTSFLPIDSIDTFTGMGYYTRSNAEICLLGTKGEPLPRLCHDISQVIYEPLDEHSRKPNIVRENIIRLFGDLPRIELFAREKTEGWHVWGNEVASDIIISQTIPQPTP
jgi:N6-adenosine-specific RNA methylase IME4